VAGEVKTRLQVDLSEFRRELELARAQAASSERRAEDAVRRVSAAERQISFADRAIDRVEQKIQSTIKQAAKAGIGTALGSALESLNVDDDLAAGGGRIFGSAVTGFGFGGLQGAGIGAATQTVAEVWRAMRDRDRDVVEMNRRLTEIAKQSERSIEELDVRLSARMEASKQELYMEAMEFTKDRAELMYQTSQYVE